MDTVSCKYVAKILGTMMFCNNFVACTIRDRDEQGQGDAASEVVHREQVSDLQRLPVSYVDTVSCKLCGQRPIRGIISAEG